MAYYSNPYYGYYPQLMQQPMMMPMQQQMMYPQQQPVEQPQQQTANAQQQQPSNTMDSYFIWVQGEAGAKSYPVARGTTVPLFDSEGDYVYFKSVDNNGVPLPLVTKVISDPPVRVKAEVVNDTPIQPQVDMSEYVTKQSYEDLLKKYSDLEMRILDLETKPSQSFNSTFTGNTFNNSRKGKDDGYKSTV